MIQFNCKVPCTKWIKNSKTRVTAASIFSHLSGVLRAEHEQQGDQVGRIFVQRVIVFVGQFFNSWSNFKTFLGNFFNGENNALLISTKNGLGYYDFFTYGYSELNSNAARVTILGEVLPIGWLDSFFKDKVDHIFGILFIVYTYVVYALILSEKIVGLHFGRFFHKLIWSLWVEQRRAHSCFQRVSKFLTDCRPVNMVCNWKVHRGGTPAKKTCRDTNSGVFKPFHLLMPML
jgi:hypothetical protein